MGKDDTRDKNVPVLERRCICVLALGLALLALLDLQADLAFAEDATAMLTAAVDLMKSLRLWLGGSVDICTLLVARDGGTCVEWQAEQLRLSCRLGWGGAWEGRGADEGRRGGVR